MSIGNKVKLHSGCFVIDPGDTESIAEFWGIEQDAIGVIVDFDQPPMARNPIIRWSKCNKPDFPKCLMAPDEPCCGNTMKDMRTTLLVRSLRCCREKWHPIQTRAFQEWAGCPECARSHGPHSGACEHGGKEI